MPRHGGWRPTSSHGSVVDVEPARHRVGALSPPPEHDEGAHAQVVSDQIADDAPSGIRLEGRCPYSDAQWSTATRQAVLPQLGVHQETKPNHDNSFEDEFVLRIDTDRKLPTQTEHTRLHLGATVLIQRMRARSLCLRLQRGCDVRGWRA
jgi:hypothetical protein